MVRLQAEDALLNGPVIASNHSGADGTFADFQNPTGDFIEWTVTVAEAGDYDLSLRYANGDSNRPLALEVNGDTQESSLDFVGTGGWSKWATVTQTATLRAGTNTVRIQATGNSGANFDWLEVGDLLGPAPVNVTISNATATEGSDNFVVFDVGLSAPSNDTIVLNLEAIDGTAKGGRVADFTIDPEGDPVDYANQAFEVSSDGGSTWQAATDGTQVSFAAGQTALKVRVALNDDQAIEPAETFSPRVAGVLAGTVDDASDTGIATLTDNDNPAPIDPPTDPAPPNDNPAPPGDGCSPISLLPCTDIRVEGTVEFDFDGAETGLSDRDGEGLGFTMVDPSSNPSNLTPLAGVVGYFPDKLDVDDGKLKITTTPGIQFQGNNSLDNALGIGLNVPSKRIKLATTLVDLPSAPGGFAQAGLWFGQADGGGAGTSEDNYIKLVLISESSGDYKLEALFEENGVTVSNNLVNIPDNLAAVDLSMTVDPFNRTVTAQYNIGDGTKTLSSFSNVPSEWFSFDQAGLNPSIATRSFGGIFATDRNAPSPQTFSFENFSVSEDVAVVTPSEAKLFDRWSVPVNNPTAMEFGPDGRLYVATLFGEIHAFELDYDTRSFTKELITTIPNNEGGGRLTLGLAIDPDSTATDVVLWVGHSDGSVNNGSFNSGKISRLSGPGFSQKEDVITGIPRAIANHATNNIDFGPDGRLYIWQGGNTGAGSANTAPTEFGDRAEQPLSAAVLAVDIPAWKANPANFDGNVASPDGEFLDEFYARKAQALGRPFTEVEVYASGLRNTYDGVFHSNGSLYAPDNGLGVTGTVPPVPRLGNGSDRNITTQFGNVSLDNPGTQNDPLNRIVEGGYYGHPNPFRDEVVFKDGSFQGFNNNNRPPGHPDYIPPFFNLGLNRSANGIIEYTADNFFGQLKGDLLITNFSQGDDITRVELSPNGLAVQDGDNPLIAGFEESSPSESFLDNFTDPLPIAMGPNGSIFVGEFNGSKVSILESRGTWRRDLPEVPAPAAILDAGSTTLNNKLYMVGGKTAAAHVSDVYVYDPGDPLDATDDIWTTAPDLPGVAVENPSVVAFDGQLYAFGGSTAPFSGAVNNAAVFNPDTSVWTPLPGMSTARGGATAQVINGEIYIAGGLDTNGVSLNTVEVFDPITGQWSAGPAMQTARDNAGSAVIDDLLYVFGGRTRTVNDALTSLEIFDPTTNQWSFGNAMSTGRRAMAVGVIGDRIQVTGGEGGGNTFAAHEEYNPVTGQWRSISSITTARHGAAFGTIDDVTYVAGGGPLSGSSFSNTVEAFTL
ncbi:MAG: kelch repeat-containing protein [Cyanobacteria bacterium J06643_4]